VYLAFPSVPASMSQGGNGKRCPRSVNGRPGPRSRRDETAPRASTYRPVASSAAVVQAERHRVAMSLRRHAQRFLVLHEVFVPGACDLEQAPA
jgi:hypothetical protein